MDPREFLSQEFNFESEYYPGSKQKRQSVAPRPTAVEPEDWTLCETVTKAVRGVPVEFYTIGALCIALDRPAVTLRLWIRKQYLPEATYRAKSKVINGKTYEGRRLYTKEQIEAVVLVAEQHGFRHNRRVDWNKLHPQVAIQIIEAWTDLASQ